MASDFSLTKRGATQRLRYGREPIPSISVELKWPTEPGGTTGTLLRDSQVTIGDETPSLAALSQHSPSVPQAVVDPPGATHMALDPVRVHH